MTTKEEVIDFCENHPLFGFAAPKRCRDVTAQVVQLLSEHSVSVYDAKGILTDAASLIEIFSRV